MACWVLLGSEGLKVYVNIRFGGLKLWEIVGFSGLANDGF